MKYQVTIYSAKGIAEKHEVEADSISMINGAEKGIVVFKKRKAIVFAVRQESFVSALPLASAATTLRTKARPPALRVL